MEGEHLCKNVFFSNMESEGRVAVGLTPSLSASIKEGKYLSSRTNQTREESYTPCGESLLEDSLIFYYVKPETREDRGRSSDSPMDCSIAGEEARGKARDRQSSLPDDPVKTENVSGPVIVSNVLLENKKSKG